MRNLVAAMVAALVLGFMAGPVWAIALSFVPPQTTERVVCDPEGENVCTAGPGQTSQLYIGTNGADSIAARGGDDHIKGKNGGDDLYGNTGRDFIKGGDGVDMIRGNQSPDTIFGGSGADILYGDEGSDHLGAANGRDTVYAYGDGRRDRINCGAGFDRAYVDRDDIVGETCERVRLGKP
jgi:Ca2+-binding RTX toxin-like protein